MWVIFAIIAGGFAYQQLNKPPTVDRQTSAPAGSEQDRILRLQMGLDFAERPLRIAIVKAQEEARRRGQFIATTMLFSAGVMALITLNIKAGLEFGKAAAQVAEAVWEVPDLKPVYNEYVKNRDKYMKLFDGPSMGVPPDALAADVAELIKQGFASGRFVNYR